MQIAETTATSPDTPLEFLCRTAGVRKLYGEARAARDQRRPMDCARRKASHRVNAGLTAGDMDLEGNGSGSVTLFHWQQAHAGTYTLRIQLVDVPQLPL